MSRPSGENPDSKGLSVVTLDDYRAEVTASRKTVARFLANRVLGETATLSLAVTELVVERVFQDPEAAWPDRSRQERAEDDLWVNELLLPSGTTLQGSERSVRKGFNLLIMGTEQRLAGSNPAARGEEGAYRFLRHEPDGEDDHDSLILPHVGLRVLGNVPGPDALLAETNAEFALAVLMSSQTPGQLIESRLELTTTPTGDRFEGTVGLGRFTFTQEIN